MNQFNPITHNRNGKGKDDMIKTLLFLILMTQACWAYEEFPEGIKIHKDTIPTGNYYCEEDHVCHQQPIKFPKYRCHQDLSCKNNCPHGDTCWCIPSTDFICEPIESK